MPRACLLVAAFAASAIAAPVPPPDPEAERITKEFGAITEPVDCKLSMDVKNSLTVKMEKVRPPKPVKPGAPGKGLGIGIPEPTGVALARKVKGEFTATAKVQLKTDLTARPDDAGSVMVGLWIEYPSGESAGIDRLYSVGLAYAPPDESQRKVTSAGVASHTNDGTATGFRGKSQGGGGFPAGDGPLLVRIRCVGKKLFLEYQADGKKWEVFDALTLKEAGEGTLKLRLTSFHGADSEVVVEKFEVK